MADISKISPDNGTTIYNLKDIEARKRVSEVLLKDTVGWTGKNLLPIKAESKTIQSVVFTVNSDGSITANGTASPNAVIWDLCTNLFVKKGKYILSGCPTGASVSTYELLINKDTTAYRDYGDGVEITFDTDTIIDNVRIIVRQNATISNQTFYPMLRDASITDDTYEPYHESVEEVVGDIRAEQAVLGAKNLLPNNASTQTINGVTFTVNADGSVTANGTASANVDFRILTNYINDEDVILSGCPVGGSSSTYKLQLYDNTAQQGYNDYGEGVNISSSEHNCLIQIVIYSGQTVDNITFYPMLRFASDPDDTYVPYAMTNRELTGIAKIVKTETAPASHDFNDYKSDGQYWINTSWTNGLGISGNGILKVMEYSGYVVQIIYRIDNQISMRTYNNNLSTWESWKTITGV